MLIDRIKLFNFRAYQGEQELALSLNPEKHVTVISGQNGFGKTSLLTALIWGLYGKLIVDVDERYRKEINESGGYSKYAIKLMNINALRNVSVAHENFKRDLKETENALHRQAIKAGIDALYSFRVSIRLTNISIPHLRCHDLTVTRTYNTRNQQEHLEILIDGKVNELTKTIGQEIFINDFILPKEIAKFFFFDAEKITALAEVKNSEEKLYFSKAYNEVLGIKKYTDLKQSLENLQLRISKKSASKADLTRLEALQKRLDEVDTLLELHLDDLERTELELTGKKTDLSDKQERLVRAGSTMTVEELLDYKQMRADLQEALARNKADFNEILELAPFAMLASKMKLVNQQLSLEQRNQHLNLINDLFREKREALKNAFAHLEHRQILESILEQHLRSQEQADAKILLEFTTEQINIFNSIWDNLQNAYSKRFRSLVADNKRLLSSNNLIHKKVQDAELKSSDPVIQKLRLKFRELSSDIQQLKDRCVSLRIEMGMLEKEAASIKKQLSEHAKNIKIEKQDQQKAEISSRIISHLSTFVYQYKLKKKASLEKKICKELNSLMHKHDFVERVNVKIDGDLIDINLFDKSGNQINKEGLSKGEQQLYATALLKALVSESNIQFPVFIDSPLQKLDKRHSSNVIKEFYPSVSSQVVLFPLLEKELSMSEYELLLPKTGKAFLIAQSADYTSSFNSVKPENLFQQFQQAQNHYV